jgi:enterochelin esterase-like enzyme
VKLLAFLISVGLFAADYDLDRRLIALAKSKPNSPDLLTELTKRIDSKRTPQSGFIAHQGDFVFAVKSDRAPEIFIDEQARGKMKQIKGSDVWISTQNLPTGTSHGVYYSVDGKQVGERRDYSAYLADSYPVATVPTGKLSEKLTFTSKLYPGMISEFWIYASAGVDPNKPAAVMVWQDGQNYAKYGGAPRLMEVTDNLVAKEAIPPMIHVMVSPGKVGDKAMRRIEYDTLSDLYTRMILEEVFPIVQQIYKLRSDAYSRAIGGESSGGICSFTSAWFRPNEFSRVLSRIGSYTSIEWNGPRPDQSKSTDGGNLYPFLVRKTKEKKNIRIWMSDGYEDLENDHGSWPLQNIQLANSLKRMNYDFRFHWGTSAHNTQQGNAELPTAMTWLWRGYDSAKAGEVYEADPAEKAKPYYRVWKLNRE